MYQQKTRNRLIGALISIFMLGLCAQMVMSATNDKWTLRNYSRTELLLTVDNVSALKPGTQYNSLGDASTRWGSIYGQDLNVNRAMNLGYQNVTTNFTLGLTSPHVTFCNNATAVGNITNSASMAGRAFVIYNTSGTGNISVVPSTGLINGASSVNVTAASGRDFNLDGANIFSR